MNCCCKATSDFLIDEPRKRSYDGLLYFSQEKNGNFHFSEIATDQLVIRVTKAFYIYSSCHR